MGHTKIELEYHCNGNPNIVSNCNWDTDNVTTKELVDAFIKMMEIASWNMDRVKAKLEELSEWNSEE